LCSAIFAHICFFIMTMESFYLRPEFETPNFFWHPFDFLIHVMYDDFFLFLVLIHSTFHGYFEFNLMVDQWFASMQGLTLNERLNVNRLYWLKDSKNNYYNPYAEYSFFKNCMNQIFPTIDFTKKHAYPRRVGPRLPLLMINAEPPAQPRTYEQIKKI